MSKSKEKRKEKAMALYRDALQRYFEDRTDEGSLTKRYYFEGIAKMIREIFGVDTSEIYQEEYWRSQGKLGEYLAARNPGPLEDAGGGYITLEYQVTGKYELKVPWDPDTVKTESAIKEALDKADFGSLQNADAFCVGIKHGEREIRLRRNWGAMPFDRAGVHATGRERGEWVYPTNGGDPTFCWFPEYEGDLTASLPCTDPDYDPEEEENG